MNEEQKTELDTALKELQDYYPTKKELLVALDEVLYMLFYVEQDCALPIELQNCAFTIRRLKNVILADRKKVE